MSPRHVPSLLLIYHHAAAHNAPTVMEHICAFERYSRFSVIKVNSSVAFDPVLQNLRFDQIVLHYSLFGTRHYPLDDSWRAFLKEQASAYKVCIFQDEMTNCPERFAFVDEYGIDCAFTVFAPQAWRHVYRKHTRVPKLVQALTGYVSEQAIKAAQRHAKPDDRRDIDIGLRARKAPYKLGRGSQEKWWIGQGFLERGEHLHLVMDISWDEGDRIYGDKWYQFVANCRAMLGAESGGSITDLDGSVDRRCTALLQQNPAATFEEVSAAILAEYEGQVPLRAISPRCFEAAVLRTNQILFEGHYDGILKPMRHYIPLKHDWSNFADVIAMFADTHLRREQADNTYQDLIASGEFRLERFVDHFDRELMGEGLKPEKSIEMDRLRLHLHLRQQAALLQHRYHVRKHLASEALGRFARRFPDRWRHKVRRALRLKLNH